MATVDPQIRPTLRSDRSEFSAYQHAVRHSARVRMMKIAFPIFSLLVLLGFIGVSMLNSVVPGDLIIDSAGIEDGKLVMNNPTMSGQTGGAQSYTLRADRAVQDLSTPDVIQLQDIRADIPINSDERATVAAELGEYNRAEDKMHFGQPLDISTTNGLVANFQSADLDIAKGNFQTDEKVRVKTEEAAIEALSLQMENSGEVIVFKDQVKMTINAGAFGSGEGADE